MPLNDPRHAGMRKTLRVVGPTMIAFGLLFTLIGLGSFFSAFNSFEAPRYFWCAFIGLPLLGLGVALTKFAFLGEVTRYMANEVAPVGKDVVNYMAHGTRDAVRDVASSLGEGFRDGAARAWPSGQPCSGCATPNDADAKFCKACGKNLSLVCPKCETANDADARFCDSCGQMLA